MNKTNGCMWCGHSQAQGAELKERRRCLGGHVKFECVDPKVCETRIRVAIIVGPPK